ncbi:hypothetical protein BDD12DRAFT_896592 [Trichophaea hybrida]|nr:hypothetical protein BDD12DRAFT_896592 [Trichophaea hybrida]
MPSSAGSDGTDGLGAVPSVLQILRTDGTVDNTALVVAEELYLNWDPCDSLVLDSMLLVAVMCTAIPPVLT